MRKGKTAEDRKRERVAQRGLRAAGMLISGVRTGCDGLHVCTRLHLDGTDIAVADPVWKYWRYSLPAVPRRPQKEKNYVKGRYLTCCRRAFGICREARHLPTLVEQRYSICAAIYELTSEGLENEACRLATASFILSQRNFQNQNIVPGSKFTQDCVAESAALPSESTGLCQYMQSKAARAKNQVAID